MKPDMSERVSRFVRGLQRLENRGEVEELISICTEDISLSNLSRPNQVHGIAGAYRFWRDYAFSFLKIHSRFSRVTETEDRAVLEWVSEGILPNGLPIVYEGVTILDFSGDRIRRFKSYFDTAAFLKGGSKHVERSREAA